MGFSLKKAFKLPSPKKFFKDPLKNIVRGDFAFGAIDPFGLRHKLNPNNIKIPGMPNFTEPKAQHKALIDNQLSAADQYSKNLGQQLESEVGLERERIGNELDVARRDIRGGANSRGMLFSGQRMAQEGGAANEAAQQLADARGSAIRRMVGQEQAMYAQPLRSRANVAETQMEQQGLLDKYRRETDQARNQTMAAGMGLIGEGAGKGFANIKAGKSFSS